MRIGFCGVHGTGKTTLVDLLSKELNYNIYKSIGRKLSEHIPVYKNIKHVDYFAQTILASDIVTQLYLNKDLIADRTIFDVFMYTEGTVNISEENKQLFIDTFNHTTKLYDIIFYIPIEFNIVKDGIRDEDETYRYYLDITLQRYLKQYYNNYVTIKGSIENRMKLIRKVIDEKNNLQSN